MTRRPDPAGAGALDYEIAQEKAAALGRLGRRLEAALAALADFDAARQAPSAAPSGGDIGPATAEDMRRARAALVREAGHALWLFLIQREACGLRDARLVIRDYRVPAEVQNCAGAFPPPQPASARRSREKPR